MENLRFRPSLKTVNATAKIHLISVFVFCLILSCAAPDIAPDVEIKKCSEYESFQIKDNLHVAMEPFQEKEIVKYYFGTDLTETGIIPILVVTENHNRTTSFLLPSAEPELFTTQNNLLIENNKTGNSGAFDTKSAKTTSSQEIDKYNKSREIAAMAITTPIILLPLVPILASVDLGPSYKAITVEQNIISKAFKKGTLSPGESESGFIYLKVPKELNQDAQLGITLKALNMHSKQLEDFNLTFTIKNR